MVKREVEYFEDYGVKNTDQTIRAAKDAAEKLGLRYVVVASATGATAVKAAMAFKESDVKLVIVSEHIGMAEFLKENRDKLEEIGVTIVTGTHAFLSPAESIMKVRGGYSVNRIIQDTLNRFSQGMNVVADVVMMAADAGAIPIGVDVVALGSTARGGGGADTAVVIKSCNSEFFFDKEKGIEFREIIAMPRKKLFYV